MPLGIDPAKDQLILWRLSLMLWCKPLLKFQIWEVRTWPKAEKWAELYPKFQCGIPWWWYLRWGSDLSTAGSVTWLTSTLRRFRQGKQTEGDFTPRILLAIRREHRSKFRNSTLLKQRAGESMKPGWGSVNLIPYRRPWQCFRFPPHSRPWIPIFVPLDPQGWGQNSV